MSRGRLWKFEEPLKKDLQELLGRFEQTNSVRYSDFSSIWRDMNFGEIFYGIKNLKEKNEFGRMALNAATVYFLPPNSFQTRVGGLYALYGLYYSQCNLSNQKIRLALKDWGNVQAFAQDAQSSQHYDVVYILHKMLAHKAFYFTAMPEQLSFVRTKKQLMQSAPVAPNPPCRPQQLVTTEMLEELANIHQHYKEVKAAVSAKHPEASLNLVRHNLVPKLHNSARAFATWQRIHMGYEETSLQPDSLEEPSTSSSFTQQQESSRRADLLASIKERSYSQVVEVAKSRRHRQPELCSAAEAGPREDPGVGAHPEARPASSQRRRRRLNNSLKYRTLQRLHGNGGIPEEFRRGTAVWQLSKADGTKETPRVARRFLW